MADQYKYSIADRNSGNRYEGRAWESIARRVWGRSAEVRQGEKITGTEDLFGMIVRKAPGDPQSYNMLAEVVLKRCKK